MTDLSLIGPLPDGLYLPMAVSRVSAGPPLPVESDLFDSVDLKEVLGLTGDSFLVRAEGDSMRDAGIAPGDVLVVAVGARPASGDVVVAEMGGQLTVKQCRFDRGDLLLIPFNPAYHPVRIADNADASVWGVVTAVIRTLSSSV